LDPEQIGEDGLVAFFSSFQCSKNSDVENFLKNKSILFEKSHNSRTYLIINTDTNGLLGYFSLTFKELHVNAISKSQAKKFDGISKSATNFRSYLIGQLGKNSAILDNPLTLNAILQFAYSYIQKAWDVIGGRTVLIECENNQQLLSLYQNENFSVIQQDGSLVQLFTLLSFDSI